MKKMKLYEADDKMIELIRDNYSILQALGAFGINMGFGDKTVKEVCDKQNVDSFTFITVVNFIINGYNPHAHTALLSMPTLLRYLKASHEYYLGFLLPFIRKQLQDALNPTDSMTPLIMRLYNEYARYVIQHMKYEEKTVFPYVEALIRGEKLQGYDVEMFSRHHGSTTDKLLELKSIIIKYLPNDGLSNNKLTATLYNLYNHEEWLQNHANVEDEIFIPAVRNLEESLTQSDITNRLSDMLNQTPHAQDALSSREKDVIVCLVQGMSNKEIADYLFISPNTVMTHRRNISRKLQIHSPAGLTIYAIVNNLIDIPSITNE